MILPTRTEAGRRLAVALERYLDHEPTVVGLSPGGIRVAHEIAQELDAPLDVFPARGIVLPSRPECLIGAIAPGVVQLDQDEIAKRKLPSAYVDHLVGFEQRELERRARFLRDEMPVLPLTGQVVIVVDDGRTPALVAATAVEGVRRAGASHVVFAAPRCTPAMTKLVRPLVDELVLLTGGTDRRTTVLCDEHFHQTTGEDVRRLIERSRSRWRGARGARPLASPLATPTD